MAGLSFRVGETKTTGAGAFEIVVETKPPAPVSSVDGLPGTIGLPTLTPFPVDGLPGTIGIPTLTPFPVDGLPGTIRIPTPILIDARLTTLAPGPHRFQLVVEDGLGRRSAPDTVVVTVVG